MDAADHVPVLPQQVLHYLDPQPKGICLDCTVGRGGHGSLIVPRLSPGGWYVGLDADPVNAEFSRRRLGELGRDVRVDLVHRNFLDARAVLDALGIDRVDMLLADLGFASNQMDEPSRGFSMLGDGPLDMRFDRQSGRTAAELVNELDERELAELIYRYGEERRSRRIARKIVERRRESPIRSTRSLAEIVRQACSGGGQTKRRGSRHRTVRIDPATRTFMALRIAVNDELGALEQLLANLPQLLRPRGVAAIISFHSLEDRRVKRSFADWHRQGLAQKVTRRVVTADDDERRANPRSRSAKLRAIRWIGP